MQYLDKLLEQFIKAENIYQYDYNSQEFLRRFSNWVIKREQQSRYYMYLILKMGINVVNSDAAEIGKTSFDSIAKNYYSTIITENIFGFNRKNRIIDSTFKIDDNGIIHTKADMKKINRIMTHNPYSINDIKNWNIYHNNGGNILIGIYGDTDDYDIDNKKEQLEQFKSKLNDNYIEEEITLCNTYCKVLATHK